MKLTDDARALLEESGYKTESPSPTIPTFYFEDPSLLGFVAFHHTVSELLKNWEEQQDHFLRENASSFGSDPIKVWNVYSIYLVEEMCPKPRVDDILAIEEDLRATRKIVRTGISTRKDVETALLSILPIKNLLPISSEEAKKRLVKRLKDANNPLAEPVYTASAKEMVRIFMEEK